MTTRKFRMSVGSVQAQRRRQTQVEQPQDLSGWVIVPHPGSDGGWQGMSTDGDVTAIYQSRDEVITFIKQIRGR